MIEEIKKEIDELYKYEIETSTILPNNTYVDNINAVNINRVLEILDKHKDKEDKYKNAWEELKKKNISNDELYESIYEAFKDIFDELEQKHILDKE